MAVEFIPDELRTFARYWVSCWDGSKAPSPDLAGWVEPEVSGMLLRAAFGGACLQLNLW